MPGLGRHHHQGGEGLKSALVSRDQLTGVGSRESLEEYAYSAGHASVILVDLDHFNAVNDIYGHQAGDHVLWVIARRLEHEAPNAETLVRLNGDQFLLALPSSDRETLEALAETLYMAVCAPIELDDAMVYIDASVGLALADAGQTVWQLISRAGAAIYASKRSGRLPKIVTFEPHSHGEILDRRVLSMDLRAALSRDELFLEYQPIVDMASREALGFEALVRWRHPVRGLVPPLRFIPLAEQSGLMHDLGLWVLEQACLTARAWETPSGPAPYVSVNLSIRQLEVPQLVSEIHGVLRACGLPPDRLKVEVTESVLAADFQTVTPPLEELRALGVGVLLDDFGTGYSSLGYVRELPLDGVKLDRIFTRDLTISAGAWTLAKSVIGLIGQLGLEIIAEGLETAAHLAQLRSLGCHVGQGYYFARPMLREDLRFTKLGRPTG